MKIKVKGFTLIEIIVVIAIIGILTAIISTAMLGYIRNARITQANANAKQVHHAVTIGLTQMAINRIPLTETSLDFTGDPTGQCILDEYDLDIEAYLGTDFKGTGYAEFSRPATYAVDFATWVNEDSPHTTWETEAEQKADAKNHLYYGVYPFKVGEAAGNNAGGGSQNAGG